MELNINEFSRDNNFANMLTEKERHNIYTNIFDNIKNIDPVDDAELQKKGIDVIVTLISGKQILCEEKVRREDYDDIFLEFIANSNKNSEGWIEKEQHSDYIIYIIKGHTKAYVLPTQIVQKAWRKYKNEWLKQYKIKESNNETYKTSGCPVPIDILYEAIKEQMIIEPKKK